MNNLILSLEDAPGTHLIEISMQTGLSESSVCRIAKKDLNLKVYKRFSTQKLSDTERKITIIRGKRMLRFIDKKSYKEYSLLTKNTQNDSIYSKVDIKCDVESERLLKKSVAFLRHVMISAGI